MRTPQRRAEALRYPKKLKDTIMRRIITLAVSFGLVAGLAGAQAPQAPPAPPPPPAPPAARALPAPPAWPPDATPDLDRLGPALRSLDRLRDMDLESVGPAAGALDFDAIFGGVEAALQSADPKALAVVRDGQAWRVGENADYDRGTSYIDAGRYDRAIEAFDKVIAANGPKADGAMYWKAYALNRLGKRTEALAVIDGLAKKHPQSRWLGDARALRLDVQRAAGQPVSPDQASDDDLKLIALNSLVARDPDRGIPMVEQILQGRASPRLKERALFVLAQSASPRAKALLANVARGQGNPDLQLKALDYLGAFSGGPDVKLLVDVYRTTSDPDVKRRVIRSLAMAGRRPFAFDMGPGDHAMLEPYAQASEAYGQAMEEARAALERARADIEKNLAESQRDRVRVDIDKAKRELDRGAARSAEREKAREARAKEARDALWQIYQSEKSPDLRRQVVDALSSMRDSAGMLVRMARTETDPALRRRIVERLSTMKDKEATDYMMEILKK